MTYGPLHYLGTMSRHFGAETKSKPVLSGCQILLNISRVDGGWVWPVQSQEWKVHFFVPQATNSIWRRETCTMATPMQSLSVGVAKSVREWFLDRRGRGFDE